MSPGKIAIIISIIIVVFIFLILFFTVTNYDSTEKTSTELRLGMLLSVLLISALSNILGDLYVNFLNNAWNTGSGGVRQGSISFFK